MNLFARFASGGTLLADGATGTWLQRAGLPPGSAPERWTLEKPDAIRTLARDYAGAGSDLVYTNTFGGNRRRLALEGLDGELVRINVRAVELAREGVAGLGRDIGVVGSIGPSGELLEPYGELDPGIAREAFLEQASALVGAGVDGLVCETFGAIEEALLAVEAAREAARGRIPVLASMAFDEGGRTAMGVTPEDAVARLTDAGAYAVGANCSVGPEVVTRAVTAMRAARPSARLLAKANAGLPVRQGNGFEYPVAPAGMAQFAAAMLEAGVLLVGGCCGTTPAHLQAMRGALPPAP